MRGQSGNWPSEWPNQRTGQMRGLAGNRPNEALSRKPTTMLCRKRRPALTPINLEWSPNYGGSGLPVAETKSVEMQWYVLISSGIHQCEKIEPMEDHMNANFSLPNKVSTIKLKIENTFLFNNLNYSVYTVDVGRIWRRGRKLDKMWCRLVN